MNVNLIIKFNFNHAILPLNIQNNPIKAYSKPHTCTKNNKMSSITSSNASSQTSCHWLWLMKIILKQSWLNPTAHQKHIFKHNQGIQTFKNTTKYKFTNKIQILYILQGYFTMYKFFILFSILSLEMKKK